MNRENFILMTVGGLTLDPVTYMSAYAVDSIVLVRKKAAAGGAFTLEQVPGGCGQIAPTTGQSSFSCETVLPESWSGPQTVYAFVKPKLFGFSVPLLFELSDDAKATFTVDSVSISLSPPERTAIE